MPYTKKTGLFGASFFFIFFLYNFCIFCRKSDSRLVVANIPDGIYCNLLPIDLGIGGYFSGNNDQIGSGQRFACHPAVRILHQTGIEYCIRYSVTNFIRMSLGN